LTKQAMEKIYVSWGNYTAVKYQLLVAGG